MNIIKKINNLIKSMIKENTAFEWLVFVLFLVLIFLSHSILSIIGIGRK